MTKAVLPPVDWSKSGAGDDLMHLQTGIFLIEIAPRLKCSIPHARCVVRNAMHVGYLEVLRVRRESPAANADACGNLGKLAANAEAALNVYLNRLERSSRKSRGMQLSIGTLRGVIPGFSGRSRSAAAASSFANPSKICFATIRKYVVLPGNDALAVALWALHAFCFDAFACTPRLAITAPEKRCGKTTLLDVVGLLVPRPLATANISTAATFRTIEVASSDHLSENEELRGNSQLRSPRWRPGRPDGWR